MGLLEFYGRTVKGDTWSSHGCHFRNRIERRNDMTAIAVFLAGTLLGSLTTITILALIGINDREDDV